MEHEITLTITEAAKELLAEEGYDPDFGARPLRRVIQSKIEDALSEGILAEEYTFGDVVEADAKDDKIIFRVIESAPESLSALPEMA